MSGRVVLLVEDDSDVRTVCADLLRHHGFQVLGARNGEEGLALAIEHRPDVILMDLDMPVMNGIEATRRLRAREDGRRRRVIALTARSRTSDVPASVVALFDAWLTKPVPLAMLVAEVRATLEPGGEPPLP